MIIADLHIHGKYSRATSKNFSIKLLEKYGNIKGLNLIGTGDFTHPLWLKELRRNLIEDNTGILKTKKGFNFVLQAEICNIYSEGPGKVRRVHNLVLAKSFEIVDQINEMLSKRGNLMADGRPIFGKYPCYELVENLKSIDKSIEIIPAHIWTPWFSLFGEKSGFNTVEECFRDQTKHIHALETGLSSDPEMNWRLSQLDKYTLISNSDCHSFWPWRIGRECNIFNMNLEKFNYNKLINILKTKKKFKETLEVDPGYGKYHFDGHRKCKVCLPPKEANKNKKICPTCGKKLTIGVLNRIEELADRKEGYVLKGAIPFRKMVPLSEVISKSVGKGIATKTVWAVYNKLIEAFTSEINILLNVPKEELVKVVEPNLVKLIMMNRSGKVFVKPGYDGEYGVPLFDNKKIKQVLKQFKIKFKQTDLDEF